MINWGAPAWARGCHVMIVTTPTVAGLSTVRGSHRPRVANRIFLHKISSVHWRNSNSTIIIFYTQYVIYTTGLFHFTRCLRRRLETRGCTTNHPLAANGRPQAFKPLLLSCAVLDVSALTTISRRSAFCTRTSGSNESTRHQTHALSTASLNERE